MARAAGAEGRRALLDPRATSSSRRSCTRSAASSRTRSASSAARASASSSTASFPAVERLVADDGWDTALVVAHGAVNRAILSYALTGERTFLGRFEQAAGCLNVLDVDEQGEWIVRAVNVAATDLVHGSTRLTTMEQYWSQYRAAPDGAARYRVRSSAA